MLLMVDENVPRPVTEFFQERNHEVIAIRDVLTLGSPDLEIATLGDELGAIVVTWDRDFKQLIRRVPVGSRRRFRRLGRISFQCKQANGRRRLERIIDSVEFEHQLVQQQRDRRLIMEISETSFRVVR